VSTTLKGSYVNESRLFTEGGGAYALPPTPRRHEVLSNILPRLRERY